MCQAHKVCAQLFGPVEQRQSVLATVCASAAKRRFFVNADPTKEDWFTIEQDLRPFGFNTAKTDLILETIRFSFDHDLIKLWVGGCPQREAGVEVDLRNPIRVRSERLTDSRFRNSDGDFLVKLIAANLHPAGDPLLRSFLQLNKIILYEGGGRLNQLHLAG